MTRAELQMLAPQNKERLRVNQVTDLVDQIYKNVVATATNAQPHHLSPHLLPTTIAPTLYRYELTNNKEPNRKYSDEFLEANMPEILEKVRDLFPDCDVSHKVLVGAKRGHDPATYTELTPFTHSGYNAWISSCIDVDWS
jgi:hypothetical protein